MNDDNLALRFGWAQRYRAAGCQGHLSSLPDTSKARTRRTSLPPRKRSAARFDPSDPSETAGDRRSHPLGIRPNFAEARRPPRKRSAARFDPSDPSETFSGVFWSFPTPRKRSAACFDTFRALGASTEAGEVCSVRAFEVPGQLPSLGRGRRPPKKRFAFTFARPQEERHRSV